MKNISRADFLRSALALTGGVLMPGLVKATHQNGDTVMTVTGPVRSSLLGFTLSHEHVMVDFIGAAKIADSRRYVREEVFKIALPILKELKQKGCKTLVECTPAYLGRDVRLLTQLSQQSGLLIVTNTGYYGAAQEKYLPPHAYTETAEQLADRWIKEWKDGIDGTRVKPGMIKSGVDTYPLSEVQQKIVTAAALTHRATGLPIGIHTGDGAAAMKELEILNANKVDPSAWIWIHAQNEKNRTLHIRAATAGGYVSFDGFKKEEEATYISFLKDMKQAGLLPKVLISHDAGWYHVGEPGGGEYRHYNDIHNILLPALPGAGFSETEIDTIFKTNPAKALATRQVQM